MEIIRKGIKLSYWVMLIRAILALLPAFAGIYLALKSLGIFGWLGDVFSGNTHSVTAGFEILFSPLAVFVGILMFVAAAVMQLFYVVAFLINFLSYKHSKKIYTAIFLQEEEAVFDIPTVLTKDCERRIIILAIELGYNLIISKLASLSLQYILPTLLPILLFALFQVFLIHKCQNLKSS